MLARFDAVGKRDSAKAAKTWTLWARAKSDRYDHVARLARLTVC